LFQSNSLVAFEASHLEQLQASRAYCEHRKRVEQILFAACELGHTTVESVLCVFQENVNLYGNQIAPLAIDYAASSFPTPIGSDALLSIISMTIAIERQGALSAPGTLENQWAQPHHLRKWLGRLPLESMHERSALATGA
jgi:hypothetical protein